MPTEHNHFISILDLFQKKYVLKTSFEDISTAQTSSISAIVFCPPSVGSFLRPRARYAARPKRCLVKQRQARWSKGKSNSLYTPVFLFEIHFRDVGIYQIGLAFSTSWEA